MVLGEDRLTRHLKKGGVTHLGIYEVIMIMFTFGTFIIALLTLVIRMINKK
ncbi:putative holin-like toxin [Virgibacillus ainsalahensis]